MATGGVLGYNGNAFIKSGGGIWRAVDGVGPVLPDMTLRFSFSNPATNPNTLGTVGTWTNAGPKVVDGVRYENCWDWTYDNSDWWRVFFFKIRPSFDPDVKVIQSGDNSKVTYLNSMFVGCDSLTSVLALDTSNVTDMGWMFHGCESLTSVTLFDTSKVTDMNSMFNDCSSLTTVPLFDTSNVTDTDAMFDHCSSLTSVPLFDTSNVTNMYRMFYDCTSLTSVPLFNISKVTIMSDMFVRCKNIESGMLALYNQASSKSIAVTEYSNCFTSAGTNTTTGMAERAQIPRSWGGDK